mmetsp:Transcript_7393/g.16763  ORF Transcript_7393/g.16763 Transcript_7393/m.16763 type:complete len:174 (-) Transcript_7393:31-552(-)
MNEDVDNDCIFPLNTTDDDDDDDVFISALLDNVNNLTLGDNANGDEDDASALTSCTTSTTRSQQRKLKRQNKKSKSKSQHSLEHLRQRVTHLMSIFEEQGWFIPLPGLSTSSASSNNNDAKNKSSKKGKVWSNRNYGADKKRQRKQSEREMLDARVVQLENVLRDEHGMLDFS